MYYSVKHSIFCFKRKHESISSLNTSKGSFQKNSPKLGFVLTVQYKQESKTTLSFPEGTRRTMKVLYRHRTQIMQNSNPGARLKSIDWHCAHQGPHANWSRMHASYSASFDDPPCAKNLELGQNRAVFLFLNQH